MLTDLPDDILILVLSYLPLSSVPALLLLSKSFNAFISSNEQAIYHSIAISDFSILSPIDSLNSSSSSFSPRLLYGLDTPPTWKSLCRRLNQTQKSWKGAGSSTITMHEYTGDRAVHRFKIDEKVGLVISTTTRGGLVVTNLGGSKWWEGRTGGGEGREGEIKVLWALFSSHVRAYAHTEYDHGYLIFDRIGSKEVWRLAEYELYYPEHSPSASTSSSTASTPAPTSSKTILRVDPTSLPDERQVAASLQASENWSHLPSKKGHFVPWALIHPPSFTRALRFVFPYLLLQGRNTGYLYDVRTGTLVQEIRDVQGLLPDEHNVITGPLLGELLYVEHCPAYVFVCGETCLRVFSRSTGRRVLDIPSTHDNYGKERWSLSSRRDSRSRDLRWLHQRNGKLNHGMRWREDAFENAGSVLYKHELIREGDRRQKIIDQIVAVHVSPCGNYFAVLLETSRILLVRDLHRIVRQEASLYDNTIEVQLGKPSRFSKYLAFENGRAGVATANGIFIVIPPSEFFSSSSELVTAPTVLRVHPLNDPLVLGSISCLQMTSTGLFVNWSPNCPLVKHGAGHATESHRRNVHAVQDDIFWGGLEAEVRFERGENGDLFVQEEPTMQESMEGVVLSVDFVPT